MKYFVVSDVHGFLNELMEALNENGFDVNNPEHKLIVCGDLFDRGPQAVELFEFVKSLGDKFIYVRGNHEDLLFDCYKELLSGFGCERHHVSNKTVDTITQFTGLNYYNLMVNTPDRNAAFKEKLEPLLDFITDKTVDYFEIGDYIFVHGWIPEIPDTSSPYWWYGSKDLYDQKWRDSNLWDSARWLNGMKEWKRGIREIGKTIVCGHYHCSYGWSHIRQQRKEFPDKNKKDWLKSFEPFVDDGIMAIDACVAYTGKVNCIVIEE